jgi:GNAT superfamily N-acetyltransferase
LHIDLTQAVADAYRWHRRLGKTNIRASYCNIVVDRAHPDVWDSNHADDVTAQADGESDAVLAAMEKYLGHTSWRVVHTDLFTPDTFLARLALENFEERPVTIQMVLKGELTDRGIGVQLRVVAGEAEWNALLRLILSDHAEGRSSGGFDISTVVSAGIVAGHMAKSGAYHFHLAILDGVPVAYGAYAAAPNGVGMIDDLFTLQSARRRGIATGMIAAFTGRLRAQGCQTIFLGALANEQPKNLYARLGFRPVGLARTWVRQ